ncbi:MAG: hypothetical protein H7Y42_13215, partial [Chitinophagaceae bacterium]|nr:hypothetical protein [Chitinophagaceae bacterium]
YIVDNTSSKARGLHIIPMPGFVISTPGKVEEVKGKGNIAEIINTELQKYGVKSSIGAEGIELPNDVDFVVRYDDLWQWDIKYYLHTLNLKFIGRNDGEVIAEGSYNSSIVHNYPNPKEVIPMIIRDIFNSPQKSK